MKVNIHAMLSFGLVNVPVGVASVVSGTKELAFVNLHETDKGRIGEKKACKTCGEMDPVTVKGYEYVKGEYIVFTAEEIERITKKQSPEISIRKFVKATELQPLMIASHNFLVPNQNVNAAYGLLYQTLVELKQVGIGTHTLYGKEHPCAVAANQDYESGVLILHTLNVFEDLNVPDFVAPIPSREEKKTAKELIGTYTAEFVPSEDLISVSREEMRAVIAAKIAGGEIPTPAGAEELEITLDLHEMMKRDLAERVKKTPAKKKVTSDSKH